MSTAKLNAKLSEFERVHIEVTVKTQIKKKITQEMIVPKSEAFLH